MWENICVAIMDTSSCPTIFTNCSSFSSFCVAIPFQILCGLYYTKLEWERFWWEKICWSFNNNLIWFFDEVYRFLILDIYRDFCSMVLCILICSHSFPTGERFDSATHFLWAHLLHATFGISSFFFVIQKLILIKINSKVN